MTSHRRGLWLLGCALVAAAVVAVLASGLLAPSEAAKLHYPRLERSFGGGGYVTLPSRLPGAGEKVEIEHLAATSDGAVYAAGLSTPKNCSRGAEKCTSPAYLARIDSDGSIAKTFGEGGRVEVAKGVDWLSPPLADSEGRALVASLEGSSVSVRRYLANGAIDTGFGTAGTTTFDCGCGAPAFGRLMLAIDNEERIVVSVFTAKSGLLPSEALARLLPDGAVDDDFGGGVVQQGGASLSMPPMGIAVGPDNEIYTWTTDCCQPDSMLFVHRVSGSGEIDARFNARSDQALVEVATRGVDRGLINASLAKLIVRPSGWLDLFGGGWLIRLRTDGRAETKFGWQGIRRLRWSILTPTLVSDGRVLALGSRPEGVSLIRLQSNGKPDRGFGKRGEMRIKGVELEGFYAEEGLTLARLRDGRAQVLDISDLTCTATCRPKPHPKLVRYRVDGG